MHDFSEPLEKIYNALPSIQCQGKCQDCCGPIGIWPAEMAYIRAGGYQIPELKRSVELGDVCSSLNSLGRCGIYDRRPFICRIWGLVKQMQCPYGCRPTAWISKPDSMAMMKQIHDLLPGVAHLTLNPRPRQKSIIEL